MSSVIIAGGSVVGLGAALALADRGHQVEIFERLADEPPADVEEAAAWQRPTVPQAVHSHAFASRGCNLLRAGARDVYDALLAVGASEINLADFHPPTLPRFTRQPADANLRMLICRRSTFELVLRQRTLSRPGVRLTKDATVRGVITADDDPMRVTGLRLSNGQARSADIVVDATGRRSAAASWLAEAGLPAPVNTSENCKIAYYTRYYRLLATAPPGPLNRGFGAGGLWDSYTAVLFLGDNRTFSISIGVLPEDTEMKALRYEAAFEAVVSATPLLADWTAAGNSEPISPVYAMGGLDNSVRLPAAGEPQTKGFFQIGDATCTTNPAYGRGVSLGLQHAFMLADLLDEYPAIDGRQSAEFAARTEALVRPWWEEAVANDRGRAALWEATLAGRPPSRPPAGVVTFGVAVAVSGQDEEVWRRIANEMMMLSPPASLYADPEIAQRIGRVMAAGMPPQLPGASRADLVGAVNGALAAQPAG